MKTTFLLKLASLIFILSFLFFLPEGFAQPGLPSAPSQAPIDGGLGLLAAAGGAYAIKKLRERNPDEEKS